MLAGSFVAASILREFYDLLYIFAFTRLFDQVLSTRRFRLGDTYN